MRFMGGNRGDDSGTKLIVLGVVINDLDDGMEGPLSVNNHCIILKFYNIGFSNRNVHSHRPKNKQTQKLTTLT